MSADLGQFEGLEEELKQGRAVVATAVDAIITIDRSGSIQLFNASAERMFGYRFDEVRRRNVSILMDRPHAEAHDDYLKHYLQTGEKRIIGSGRRVEGRRKDGTAFPMHLAVSEFEVGGERRFTGIIRDISAEVEAENRLRQVNQRLAEEKAKLVHAEKLSALGTLVAGVAHEINNPLAGIKSCVGALGRGRLDDSKRDAYVNAISDGLQRIETTVRSLLDFARPSAPKTEELTVGSLATACQTLLRAQLRHARVDLQVECGPLTLHADRSAILQAMLNLILNALYVSPEGSRITLREFRRPGFVGVGVCDQGPGIPEAVKHRVFEPFFSTKPEGEGTGLGLAVTLGVLQSHGGDMSIEDVQGGGTCVILWFPDTKEGDQ